MEGLNSRFEKEMKTLIDFVDTVYTAAQRHSNTIDAIRSPKNVGYPSQRGQHCGWHGNDGRPRQQQGLCAIAECCVTQKPNKRVGGDPFHESTSFDASAWQHLYEASGYRLHRDPGG